MAELVGVIASGVSIGTLVVQIGSSIATLKEYLDEVNEAPEAMRILLEDIEYLQSILADMQDDQDKNPISSLILDNTSPSRCLLNCKRAAEQLKALVDEVGTDMDASGLFRRKRAALKIVLKGKKIQGYKEKLERTVRLLELSQSCYTRSLIRLQPEIIAARLSRSVVSSLQIVPTDISNDYEASHSSNNGSNSNPKAIGTIIPRFRSVPPTIGSYLFGFVSYERRRFISASSNDEDTQSRGEDERDTISAFFRPPAWLINRAWAVEGRHAYSGWNFSISTYNIVSQDSLVMAHARNGSVSDLRELFRDHLASPFDVDEYGHTALHHAADSARLEACQFLLDNGASELAINAWNNTPLDLFVFGGIMQPISKEESLGIARLLSKEVELSVRFFYQFYGHEEEFLFFQQELYPPYCSNSFHDRVSIALSLTDKPFTTPKLFQLALSEEPLELESYKYIDDMGNSLVHAVARAYGSSATCMKDRFYRRNRSWPVHRENAGWLELLVEYVKAGCNIHGIRLDEASITSLRTPFLEVIYGSISMSHIETSPDIIEHIMSGYLLALKKAGIDLVSYGQKEAELHNQHSVDKTFGYYFVPPSFKPSYCSYSAVATWHLIGFTYGPSPDDWRIWGSQPTDDFAGDFWYMIESLPEKLPGKIPGAWVD